MKKIAIVLAGCGVFDGTEIHEAILSMLAVEQLGAQYTLFAPDIDQAQVVNHLTGKPTAETRNVLVESARIARGKIKNLNAFKAADFDGLLFPGGSGAAKNLSDYAFKGSNMSVHPEVEQAIKAMHESGKPIGALCIAPVILARVIDGSAVTIGNDAETTSHIEKMGTTHKSSSGTSIVIDEKNNIVTTSCYMLNTEIKQVYEGARNVVEAMIAMMI